MIFTRENDIWKSVNVRIALRSSCPCKHKLISSLHLEYILFLMNFTEQMEPMELGWRHQNLGNKEIRAAEVEKQALCLKCQLGRGGGKW